jgi:hypothetical protein
MGNCQEALFSCVKCEIVKRMCCVLEDPSWIGRIQASIAEKVPAAAHITWQPRYGRRAAAEEVGQICARRALPDGFPMWYLTDGCPVGVRRS